MLNYLHYFIIFIVSCFTSLYIETLSFKTSITLIVISVLVLLLILVLKFFDSEKLHNIKRPIAESLVFTLVNICILLLIFATGGITGPFFILIHITTLFLAFSINFTTAMTYLLLSLIVIGINLNLNLNQALLVRIDLPILIIDALSLGVIIPLSYVISKRYFLKDKLASYLEKKLILTQGVQSLILESVDKAIITTTSNFLINEVNTTVNKITGFKEDYLRNKPFFSVFAFKDEEGNKLDTNNFPLKALLSAPSTFRENNIEIRKSDGTFIKIDLHISSILGVNKTIDSLVFVFNDVTKETTAKKLHNVLLLASYKMNNLLTSIFENSTLPILKRESLKAKLNFSVIETLSQLESGQMTGLISYVDLGEIARNIVNKFKLISDIFNVKLTFLPEEKLIKGIENQPASGKKLWEKGTSSYHPNLPIAVMKNQLEKALEFLVQLSIFIASESKNPTVNLDVYKINTEGLCITIRTSCNKIDLNKLNNLISQPVVQNEKDDSSLLTGLEGYVANLLISQTGGKLEINTKDINYIEFIITVYHPKGEI